MTTIAIIGFAVLAIAETYWLLSPAGSRKVTPRASSDGVAS